MDEVDWLLNFHYIVIRKVAIIAESLEDTIDIYRVVIIDRVCLC